MTQFCPDPPPKCEISHFFFFFSSETFPNTSAVTKPVEKRQKELIEYFEKLVDKHKISNFVD